MWYERLGVYAFLKGDIVDYYNIAVGYTYSYSGIDIAIFQSYWKPCKYLNASILMWSLEIERSKV